MANPTGTALTLLPATAITAAVTGSVGATAAVRLLAGATYVALQATFVRGSGGTTAKAWVQTSLDGGTTWRDIACFAFTTSSATKFSAVKTATALTAATAASDGALADDTITDGLLGDRLRVKYTTTGTYGGTTTLAVAAVVKA